MSWAQISQNGDHHNLRQWVEALNSNVLWHISMRYHEEQIVVEIGELIDNMSLNEYRPQYKNRVVNKKQGIITMETHDALQASIELLSAKLEK